MKLALLGGDRRMLFAAEHLSVLGHDVRLAGGAVATHFSATAASAPDDWLDAAGQSESVILPLCTQTADGAWILQAPPTAEKIPLATLAEVLHPGQPVLAGMPPEPVRALFFSRGLTLLDYFARDELAIANAVPTAQGVLALLMDALEVVLADCAVCITGYGRCARALARALRGLGTRVSIAVRRRRDLVQVRVDGYTPLSLADFPENAAAFDAIINTVPEQILGAEALGALKKDCLLIEIASAPFGIDRAAAATLGLPLIYAPSLPGKAAPKTAGLIIADTVHTMLQEWQSRC
ncbi:MAG: dipicolinate synthase [Oscillospiraceae bacterium]|nr:dipicolinate synthase [Oscillospiraceae bacterium]